MYTSKSNVYLLFFLTNNVQKMSVPIVTVSGHYYLRNSLPLPKFDNKKDPFVKVAVF
jgi:hypothetical protein